MRGLAGIQRTVRQCGPHQWALKQWRYSQYRLPRLDGLCGPCQSNRVYILRRADLCVL